MTNPPREDDPNPTTGNVPHPPALPTDRAARKEALRQLILARQASRHPERPPKAQLSPGSRRRRAARQSIVLTGLVTAVLVGIVLLRLSQADLGPDLVVPSGAAFPTIAPVPSQLAGTIDWSTYPPGTQKRIDAEAAAHDCAPLKKEVRSLAVAPSSKDLSLAEYIGELIVKDCR